VLAVMRGEMRSIQPQPGEPKMRHYGLGLVFLVMTGVVAADETVKSPVDLSTVTCKDIMSGDDRGRELAMAYMHGYLNGKAGGTTVELDKNAEITDKVRDFCLDNPSAKFAESFETLSK
jgi:hypothetical protein